MRLRPCVVPTFCFVVVLNFVWILQKETFSVPLCFSHCLYVHECVCACVCVCIMWVTVSMRSSYVNGVFIFFSQRLWAPQFRENQWGLSFKHDCGFSQVSRSLSLFFSVFKWMGSKNPNIRSSLPHLPLSFYQLHLSLQMCIVLQLLQINSYMLPVSHCIYCACTITILYAEFGDTLIIETIM